MPVVMFAGEATHRQFPGTAHGAYMSGYREASRLLEALDQLDSMAAWKTSAMKSEVMAAAAESGGFGRKGVLGRRFSQEVSMMQAAGRVMAGGSILV